MSTLNKNFVVVCITMVICTALGVYGFLGVHKVDTQGFLSILGTTVGPFIGILWNNFATKKAAKQISDQQDQITTIEKNTNGTLSKLTDAIPEQVKTVVEQTVQETMAKHLEGESSNAD